MGLSGCNRRGWEWPRTTTPLVATTQGHAHNGMPTILGGEALGGILLPPSSRTGIIERLKLRPSLFLGHKLLLYHNHVTVSIPSNKSILGIERLTWLWYSAPRLLEPMPRGRRAHGMRGARGAVVWVERKFLH